MNSSSSTSVRQVLTGLEGKTVCPFCGAIAEGAAGAAPCARCTMENTPATRQATRARIGPWYVLQVRNPSAPGMKFATLVALIRKGQVTPRSILRGPTTHQFWRFAAKVRGISREFGLCYSCAGEVEPATTTCPHCQRPQAPPADPDTLLEPRDPPQQVRATIHRQVPAPGDPSIEPDPAPPAPVKERPRVPFSTEPVERRGMTDEITENLLASTASRKPVGQEILTPQELAAVFQLKTPAAPDTADPRGRAPRAGHPVRSTLLVLIVLGALGAGAWLYLFPEARQEVMRWARETYVTAKQFIQGVPTPQPEELRSMEAPQSAGEPQPIIAPAPTSPTPVVPEPVAPEPPQELPFIPAPGSVEVPQADPAPAPVPRVESAEQPDSSEPVYTDPDAAIADARRLWREAITAEGLGDYAQAVQHYEQIKRLPPYARPSGLDLRLELARKQLEP